MTKRNLGIVHKISKFLWYSLLYRGFVFINFQKYGNAAFINGKNINSDKNNIILGSLRCLKESI